MVSMSTIDLCNHMLQLNDRVHASAQMNQKHHVHMTVYRTTVTASQKQIPSNNMCLQYNSNLFAEDTWMKPVATQGDAGAGTSREGAALPSASAGRSSGRRGKKREHSPANSDKQAEQRFHATSDKLYANVPEESSDDGSDQGTSPDPKGKDKGKRTSGGNVTNTTQKAHYKGVVFMGELVGMVKEQTSTLATTLVDVVKSLPGQPSGEAIVNMREQVANVKQQVEDVQGQVVDVKQKVDGMDEKLDKLLDALLNQKNQ